MLIFTQQREDQLAVAVNEGGVVFLVVFEARPAVEFGKSHGGSAREPAELCVGFDAVLGDGSGRVFTKLGAVWGGDNIEVLPAAVNLFEGAADRQDVGEVVVEVHDSAPGFVLPAERVSDFAGERLGDDPFGEGVRFGSCVHDGLSEGS